MNKMYNNKEQILQRHLQDFVNQLSQVVGESALAAVIVVQWNTETTAGVVMPMLPKEQLTKIVKVLGRAITANVERLESQVASIEEENS